MDSPMDRSAACHTSLLDGVYRAAQGYWALATSGLSASRRVSALASASHEISITLPLTIATISTIRDCLSGMGTVRAPWTALTIFSSKRSTSRLRNQLSSEDVNEDPRQAVRVLLWVDPQCGDQELAERTRRYEQPGCDLQTVRLSGFRERATARQELSPPGPGRHGSWYFHVSVTDPIGRRERLRRVTTGPGWQPARPAMRRWPGRGEIRSATPGLSRGGCGTGCPPGCRTPSTSKRFLIPTSAQSGWRN